MYHLKPELFSLKQLSKVIQGTNVMVLFALFTVVCEKYMEGNLLIVITQCYSALTSQERKATEIRLTKHPMKDFKSHFSSRNNNVCSKYSIKYLCDDFLW